MPAHMTTPIGLAVLLLAVTSLVGVPAHAASVLIDLCAKTGSITLPDLTVVPIWGFVTKIPSVGCDDSQHVAGVPGPAIRVTAGDVVTINVHNRLSVPISILIPGQQITPLGGGPGTFTNEVASGSIGGYRFTAITGTYIYESGTDPQRQVAMGLHGALIVASGLTNPNTGQPQAYSQNHTSFDNEAVLVLSEIDPNLHANPLGFNMLNYAPRYWLINGKAYPDTAPIQAGAGQHVLLRYLNPSNTHHAMALLGLHQRVIAREAFKLPTAIRAVAETIPAGTTADMITTLPGTASPGTRFPLYNRNMQLTNASANAPGGMQTGLTVVIGDQAPVVDAGPDQVIVAPTNHVTLNGSATDDGLPAPPRLTTTWSKASGGPGTVTFGDAAAVATTATFSANGTYVLRLWANDGALTASDVVRVLVSPANPSGIALGVFLDKDTFQRDELLQAGVIVANSGPAVVVDVFLVVLFSPDAGAGLGCPGGDAAAFVADNFSRAEVRCLSASPQSFPALFQDASIPGSLPATTVLNFFSMPGAAGLSPGTYTIKLVLTPPNAFADGTVGPADLLAVAAATFTVAAP